MDDIIYFFTPRNTINEMYYAERITLKVWEQMLAEGWRHNGKMVFRSSHDFNEEGFICNVLPLRYRLKGLALSKSQRIIFKRNQDLRHEIRPLSIDTEKHTLFAQHIQRFTHRIPTSLWDFISPEPNKPFKTWELCVYKNDKLIAVSFIDITSQALSSTYAMFDLAESKRSLGIYTMILELLYAQEKKKKFYYPGYAYDVPSFFDYKKKFNTVEFYDWQSRLWLPLKNA